MKSVLPHSLKGTLGGRLAPQRLFRFLLFSLFGAAATAVHYTILMLGVQALDADPVVASTCGAVFGALVSYVLNYHVTFCATAAHRVVLARFLGMVVLGLALNMLCMHALVDVLNTYYMAAQVLTTLLVLVSNYLISAKWVFMERGK